MAKIHNIIPGGNCIGYGWCKGAIVSSMTFLLGKYLKQWESYKVESKKSESKPLELYELSNFTNFQTNNRFRQGKTDSMVVQSYYIKRVIFSTALPAGYSNGGTSNNMGTNAYFWTATENNATNAWNRNLNTGNAQSNRNNNNKTNGFSVRCLQNWLLKTGRGRFLSLSKDGLCLFFPTRMTMNNN